MHMPNMILKRIIASSKDAIMEDMHMKEQRETKNDELVYKVQNLMGSSIKVKLV